MVFVCQTNKLTKREMSNEIRVKRPKIYFLTNPAAGSQRQSSGLAFGLRGHGFLWRGGGGVGCQLLHNHSGD